MKLDFAIFANHATVAANGLFSLLEGGVTTFSISKIPAVCPTLCLVARFSFEANECENVFPCVVKVASPTARHLSPDLTAELKPRRSSFHGPYTITTLYTYNGFELMEVGVYRFTFFLGEVALGEASLEVQVSESHSLGS